MPFPLLLILGNMRGLILHSSFYIDFRIMFVLFSLATSRSVLGTQISRLFGDSFKQAHTGFCLLLHIFAITFHIFVFTLRSLRTNTNTHLYLDSPSWHYHSLGTQQVPFQRTCPHVAGMEPSLGWGRHAEHESRSAASSGWAHAHLNVWLIASVQKSGVMLALNIDKGFM